MNTKEENIILELGELSRENNQIRVTNERLIKALKEVNDTIQDELDAFGDSDLLRFAKTTIKRALKGKMKYKNKVVIEVLGGIAEVTQCPDHIEVEIIDHDNKNEEEGLI